MRSGRVKDSKERDTHNTINDDTFKNRTTDLIKGNEHLITYFKELEKKDISRLIVLMNEL